MGRIWYVSVREADGGLLEVKEICDRDEMAAFLMDMDMRGYALRQWEWEFQCFASTPELVDVNLTIEFANWSMSNIVDEMPKILGQERRTSNEHIQ